jgi:anthranilate phosphoribosyltransferase
MRILEGRDGAQRDIAVFNAAAAIVVAGLAGDLPEGIRRAQEALMSGAAMRKINQWKEASNS